MMQTIEITLPCQEHKIYYKEANITFFIGSNGSGKTISMNLLKDYFKKQNKTFTSYDPFTAEIDAERFAHESTDDEFFIGIQTIMSISKDFDDDIKRWVKFETGTDDYSIHLGICRNYITEAGSGYKKFFTMIMKYVCNSSDYYFIEHPETSLHVALGQKILGLLFRSFGSCKFIVSTHAPEIIAEWWNDDNADIIDMGQPDENEYEIITTLGEEYE